MKRIGKLNNKIVVQGDPNLVKSNQILYKEDSNGIVLQERKQNNLENITAGEGNGSNNMKISYYKISEDFDFILKPMLACGISINNIKLKEDEGISIIGYLTPLSFDAGHYWRCIGVEIIEYVPIQQFGSFDAIETEINKNTDIYGMLEQLIPIFDSIFGENSLTMDVIKQNIISITKEEFYNLNN